MRAPISHGRFSIRSNACSVQRGTPQPAVESLCWVNCTWPRRSAAWVPLATEKSPIYRIHLRSSRERRARHHHGLIFSAYESGMQSQEPQQLVIPVISVPEENYLMAPGEVSELFLEYELFQSMLQGGSTFFGCVNAKDCENGVIGIGGALLTVLAVKSMEQGEPPRVLIECRCSGRFSVLRPASESSTNNLDFVRVEKVRDRCADSISERREVAQLEWALWQSCKEVVGLVRKLQNGIVKARAVELELSVWAPREYDRDIEEHEWESTPQVTRQVYWERAECFSFGVLRWMDANEELMRTARRMTNTADRLRMALLFVDEKRAKTSAQLSLKNALS